METKKIAFSVGVSVAATMLVYLGLQSSLNQPIINRLPIPAEAAISIALKEEEKYLKQTDTKDLSVEHVYIVGNGSFFESNINSNSISKYLGRSEPTKTAGDYFAWKVTNKKNNRTYFIDEIDGEVISQK